MVPAVNARTPGGLHVPRPQPRIATEARPLANIALVLAILSVPGSLLTWDVVPGGGFVTGLPLAVGAVVLGVQARRQTTPGAVRALPPF